MKRRVFARKFFAWTLCLVMLVSLAAPVLAAEEDAPPAAAPAEAAPAEAPAAKAEAPAEKAEAPAVKAEAPAEKAEAPAEKAEAPAKAETPADKAEVPAKDDTSAAKAETSVKDEAPAEKAETSTKGETSDEKAETPVKDDASADKAETPVEDKAPAKAETPAVKTQAPADDEDTPAAKATEATDSDDDEDNSPAEVEPEDEVEAEPEEAEADESQEELSASLFSVGAAAANPNGFVNDWAKENVVDSGWGTKHGLVQTSRGYYLYFDTPEWNDGMVTVTTPSHPNTWQPAISFISVSYNENLLNGANNRAPIEDDGVEVTRYTAGGRRYTEAFIPTELFPDEDLTFLIGDGVVLATFAAESGDDPDAHDDDVEPVYTGITIDGDFSDWDAVPFYEIDDFRGYNTVEQVAMVWDGDWVYILLYSEGDRDWQGNLTGMGNWTSVTGAGTHGNGQYAITTDLGRTLLVQPVVNGSNEPAVAGVDGAKAAVNNKAWEKAPHLWELAIPASELPEYLETINFGFYMEEPVITNVSDMAGVNVGQVDPFKANVVIDGKYNDWVGYPHTLIQYDHQGIQHHQVDGEAALWSDDGMLYGHVVTEHPDHLAEQGSCFLAAISIAFNGDREFKFTAPEGNFYPRILDIRDDGSILDFSTLNEGYALSQGTHTFYIFDGRTDPVYQFTTLDENNTAIATPTGADLKANAFGIMKVTVTGTKDEMEFSLDLEKVAKYIGQDADTAFKTIEAQFGRIGQQWVTTAGTPTGPILGVALAVGAIGAPMCYTEVKKRRGAKKSKDDGEAK